MAWARLAAQAKAQRAVYKARALAVAVVVELRCGCGEAAAGLLRLGRCSVRGLVIDGVGERRPGLRVCGHDTTNIKLSMRGTFARIFIINPDSQL